MWSFLSDFPSDIPFQTTREFILKFRWCMESCGTMNCLLCTHTWTSECTQRYFILNCGPFKDKTVLHIVLVMVYFTLWNIQIHAYMHLWPLFMFDTEDPLFIFMATLLPSHCMQSAPQHKTKTAEGWSWHVETATENKPLERNKPITNPCSYWKNPLVAGFLLAQLWC